jgi:hypothetical protein
MSLKTFLSIKSVICFLCALPELIAPAELYSIYGIALNPGGELISRWLGCFTFGVGIICWIAGRSDNSPLRKGVLLGLFICDTIGFIAALVSQLGGAVNAFGWGLVVLWGLLAAGLGYFRFIAKNA